ncbi:MAG TPA: sulfate ABC transporter ATP-binding protein [Candidatus Hydrogenedentes bacterium]|nr:sulfate ABC transporter ATP-binding protein [Candidatus Hydrogenedentota bacterium]
MSIEVRNISKTFGRFSALKHVSLRVEAGELVALLGPSGSGKTTLLRIIAGLDVPDPSQDMQVLLSEEDVAARHVGSRQVGFVFQHYALFRHMTVFDNIAFGLRVRPRQQRPGRKEIEEKVTRLLRLIQLENLGNRYPSQLSGGQRQRVALARALAIEPKVLLLDEPFGALDARVRQDLRNWLRRLHEEIHITSVFVTHDQEEALELADRVVVMNEGKIEQVGTPDEVFHHPKTEFVMRFMGHVNLFHGRVESDKAVFGPWELEPDEGVYTEGKDARLFVRPHEMDILREPDGRPMAEATVKRIHSAGPYVKVELHLESGEILLVELSHDRFREINPVVGEKILVGLRNARVFSEDYVI